MSGLENLLPKILVHQRCLLKLIYNLWFKLTIPLVINFLSVHYLWLAKPWKFYHKPFFLKEKSVNLEILTLKNFRLYSSYLLLSLVRLLSYVEINVYSNLSTLTVLLWKCPKMQSQGINFQNFSGGIPPDPSSFVCLVYFACCAQQYNNDLKITVSWSLWYNFNLTA